MKWLAILAFASAILVRLMWHSSFELAFRLNETTHKGYSLNSIAFWILVIIGVVLTVTVFLKRTI